jgi:molybdopterin-guanine dinucleotide biosynthesis protein A
MYKMKVSVSIQAGGQSRRMGQNKALMPFMGEPLIQRVVERVRPIASELFIISNEQTAFEFLNLPIIPDLIAGRGVLGGLYTSLSTSTNPFVASVACDMPFINPVLLQAELELLLTSGVDVVIPESPNGLEPLHAVYRRDTCLPCVHKALIQEQRRLISWFEWVTVRIMTLVEVAELDPDKIAFININTADDLFWAESLARGKSKF